MEQGRRMGQEARWNYACSRQDGCDDFGVGILNLFLRKDMSYILKCVYCFA